MLARLASASVLLALVAGCAEPADHSEAGHDADGTAAGSDSLERSADPDAAAASAATRARHDAQFGFDGTTSTGACAFVMTGTCQYALGAGSFQELEAKGDLAWVNGTLTWDALSPTSDELVVYLLFRTADGYRFDPDHQGVRGASPLTFTFKVSRDDDAAIAVSSYDYYALPMGYATTAVSQDFHLEGTSVAFG